MATNANPGNISDQVLAAIPTKIIGEKNARGIPSTVFVEDVANFLSSLSLASIEPLIGAQQQLYR